MITEEKNSSIGREITLLAENKDNKKENIKEIVITLWCWSIIDRIVKGMNFCKQRIMKKDEESKYINKLTNQPWKGGRAILNNIASIISKDKFK